jgi:hypothetical protein
LLKRRRDLGFECIAVQRQIDLRRRLFRISARVVLEIVPWQWRNSSTNGVVQVVVVYADRNMNSRPINAIHVSCSCYLDTSRDALRQ